jgi:hypothetical protein
MLPEARTSSTATTVCLNDPHSMIAIDASALMAIALGDAEAEAEACMKILETETDQRQAIVAYLHCLANGVLPNRSQSAAPASIGSRPHVTLDPAEPPTTR